MFQATHVKACPICASTHFVLHNQVFDDRYGFKGLFSILRCTECSHKFLDAAFSSEQISKLYTEFYPRSKFDLSQHKSADVPNGWRFWLAGKTRAYCLVPPKVRVLDIGCGFGESLAYHKSRGCEVYGVEADENILRVAEKYGYNVRAGTFEHKNYAENFFDYVTMDQVAEHTSKPSEILNGIKKILKPGGFLIVTVPNAAGWGAKLFKQNWIHWHVPYHLQHFSKKSLSLAAAQAGFRVKTIKTLTASEWLYYQLLHLMNLSSEGQPSRFWDKDRLKMPAPVRSRRLLELARRYKVLALITRFFDALGYGDNILAVFEKAPETA